MWKEKNIVMLPTDNISDIILGIKASTFNAPMINRKDIDSEWERFGTNQHLYIISDEEIKEGNWFIDLNNKQTSGIQQCTKSHLLSFEKEGINCKRITATTDKLAVEPYQVHFEGIDCTNYITHIPESFITLFIEEYNKGNIIEKVEVEYENCTVLMTSDNAKVGRWVKLDTHKYTYERIKLNTDNTVNIRIKKDIVYTEEEVKRLIFRACVRSTESLEEWFEQNKKK